MPISPIFVPSRGRHSKGQAKFLINAQEQHLYGITVVCEPQEKLYYENAFPKFHMIALPVGGMGITYVRNFIKQHTENLNFKSYWMLDDDLFGFYERKNGCKMHKIDARCLEQAEYQFSQAHPNISLGALEYQQFAWNATQDIKWDGYADACVWVDNMSTRGMRYHQPCEGKEDRDFAIQIIAAGLHTARTTKFAFANPANGSNEGGMKDIFYDIDGREARCARAMVERWGSEICQTQTKTNGRQDVKIHWDNIVGALARKKTQQTLFGD